MIHACPLCRYSFEGLPLDRACPECGFACDRGGVLLRRARLSRLELALRVIFVADAILFGVTRFGGALTPRELIGAVLNFGGLALGLWGLRRMRLQAFALISDNELIVATDRRHVRRYPMGELTMEAGPKGEPRLVHAGVRVRPPFIGRDHDVDSRFWREVNQRLIAPRPA